MALIDDITLGRFVPGDSILHRLDPRLKLGGLPVLVIAAFAAHTAGQRLALFLLAGTLILLAGGHWRFFLRGLWALRWLFLCTVLLHLLFSPGRTLFGSVWLSLDGLLRLARGDRTGGLAALQRGAGFRPRSTTSHPAMIAARRRSPWRLRPRVRFHSTPAARMPRSSSHFAPAHTRCTSLATAMRVEWHWSRSTRSIRLP